MARKGRIKTKVTIVSICWMREAATTTLMYVWYGVVRELYEIRSRYKTPWFTSKFQENVGRVTAAATAMAKLHPKSKIRRRIILFLNFS